MEKVRVNKITSVFNDNGGVTITLYRTHNKLGQLTSDELGIASFSDSGATNKSVYMQYCKDTVIELLKNNGVEGFYYDPATKGPQAENGYPSKFDRASFMRFGADLVKSKILDCTGDSGISIGGMPTEDGFLPIDIQESYKDGLIKYATVPIRVILVKDSFTKTITVPTSIRSGQLCKPKMFTIDDVEKSLNPTNIKGLFAEAKAPKVTTTTSIIGAKDGVPKDAELVSIEITKDKVKQTDESIATTIEEPTKTVEKGPKNDTEKPQEAVAITSNGSENGISDEVSGVMGMFKEE